MATNMFSLGSAFSKMETNPVNYWEDWSRYFSPNANQFRTFVKGDQRDLFNQFSKDYLAGSGQAKENAQLGQDYLRGLLTNQPDQFKNYTDIGNYLYGKLDDFSSSLKDSGLRDMNARLAGLGIRPGSTGYDRLLNATRITNNLAPAFANTTNAIGNDYSRLAGQDFVNTLLRTNLVNTDALNAALDRVYARPLNVANARMGQFQQNQDLLGNMANFHKINTAGFETKETSDLAKGLGVVDNLLNGVVDLYMSAYGGGMMGGGQVGSGNNANPYSFTSMSTPGAGGGTTGGGSMGNIMQYLKSLFGGSGAAPANVQSSPLGDWNYNPQIGAMA